MEKAARQPRVASWKFRAEKNPTQDKDEEWPTLA
jgi:hypothetical protein